MPVLVKEILKARADSKTTEEKIIELLRTDRKHAYTTSEIAAAINRSRSVICAVLRKLVKQKKVRKVRYKGKNKKPQFYYYWAGR